ncbi:MAG: ribokinase [Opitutaceae bacterium]
MLNDTKSAAGRVVVVGSLNVDRIVSVAELPRPGETIFATSTQKEFGGKGANQAVAAARYGASVALVGAVGSDADGESYLAHLRSEGVATEWVLALPRVTTGTAFITVNARGENEIVVDRGANGQMPTSHVVAALAAALPTTDIVVVGLECPLAPAVAALRSAAASGVRSIFNPSPVVAEFPWGEIPIDTVVVNEHECATIFGAPEPGVLRHRQVRHLIVTRGAAPTLWVSAEGMIEVPPYAVTPRDTVGAGDTFTGVLAATLAAGARREDALIQANVAAALSTLAPGAQTAMPRHETVQAAIATRPRSAGRS